jgi:pimeloyl-ACP methyl ester carboxylesterase
MPVDRFKVDIPGEVLRDLATRLEMTRFPNDFSNDDWSYGANIDYIRSLIDYWKNEYDWRKVEAKINAFDNYKTTIDDVPIHFIKAAGKGPNPMPLILSHGWPWTFWDLHKVIGPLSDPEAHGGDPRDSFDVIVPSLPGYGFSTPVETTGINFLRTADLGHQLMTGKLGYSRFAAQGGDWGAIITSQLGYKYSQSVIGLHQIMILPLNMFNTERPWDITGGQMIPEGTPADQRAKIIKWQDVIVAHVAVQMRDPQTLAAALNDSPAGLLAWLMERRRAWSCCDGDLESIWDKEFLITTAMIYWVTQSIGTSMRFYAEAARNPWQQTHGEPVVKVPVGLSHMLGDGTKYPADPDTSMFTNVIFENSHEQGGHFGPSETPDMIVEDIRATFRSLR